MRASSFPPLTTSTTCGPPRPGAVVAISKPNDEEVKACWPWLEAEVASVKPQMVVCLGATAAQAVLGRQFKVTQRRGEVIESSHGWLVAATVHPSSILRAADDDARRTEYDAFVRDLRSVARVLDGDRRPQAASP